MEQLDNLKLAFALVLYWLFCVLVVVVVFVLPIVWIVRRVGPHLSWTARERRRYLARARKLEDGVCPAYGYDLPGNVSGTCPECGGTLR